MSDNEKHTRGPASTPRRKTSEAGGDCLEDLARDIVYQTSEVRPEKVARLKEAIEQGSYEIDSDKLAEILAEEVLGKR